MSRAILTALIGSALVGRATAAVRFSHLARFHHHPTSLARASLSQLLSPSLLSLTIRLFSLAPSCTLIKSCYITPVLALHVDACRRSPIHPPPPPGLHVHQHHDLHVRNERKCAVLRHQNYHCDRLLRHHHRPRRLQAVHKRRQSQIHVGDQFAHHHRHLGV